MKVRLSKPLVLITVGTVVVATGMFFALHKRPAIVTGGPNTKGIPSSNGAQQNSAGTGQTQQSTSTGNTSNSDGSKTPSPDSTTATLTEPLGPFVSNHTQSLSNNTINSVCNTTSGATCEILFTQGSVTKVLPPQVTDKGGATYWSWHLKDIGIATTGTWKITAKATLGSQVQTASDANNLVVTQ